MTPDEPCRIHGIRRCTICIADPLADVFEDTEHAPVPLISRNRAGGVRSLWANPADPRWHVHARLSPDGEVEWIHCIRPREASA